MKQLQSIFVIKSIPENPDEKHLIRKPLYLIALKLFKEKSFDSQLFFINYL